MANLPLGLTPLNVPVLLTRDGAFVASLTKDSGTWPGGTTVELWFQATIDSEAPIIWPATIVGAVISWHVDSIGCEAVIDADAKFVRLHFNDLTWGTGRVTVK